ncbi:MAG TPA: lysine-2,3-aminomutase-like protein [Micropepsaceae bacterium]|jgi:lysine 2,3-aminomutase|nr:lysine-2,3-aminomutase-like protein [Micropepsaceae bacterium]
MLEKRRTLRTPQELAAAGLLKPDAIEPLAPVSARYAIAVTPAIADLIDTANPEDPIARQFVPSPAEAAMQSYERADPIGDERHSPVKGIVHRYPDRVLLKLTHICPVYCRFCFRREMVGPGEDQMLNAADLDTALAYIAAHPEIWEVILTGGDPFMLSPRRLQEVTARLAKIGHVKILRWHTRMPIADPDRITPALVHALRCAKTTYVAIHVNHPRELTEAARRAAARLLGGGISLLSQSVLLKGVNDDVAVLEALMRALVEARIQPYYLHHMDLAPGTSHFRTTIAEGQHLIRELRARMSGLCLPHYVLDIPGGYAKALLTPCDAEGTEASYRLRDGEGREHNYLPS